MRSCQHEALVEVSASDQPCLVDPYRLQRLVDSLPNPGQQQPLIVAFFGGDEKRLAVDQLFPANDTKARDRRPGLCKVYADALTTHAPNPIIFVDIDPDHAPPVQDTKSHCHHLKAFRMQPSLCSDRFCAILVKQLLLPFIDVLCIFADDVGGYAGVLHYLQLWTLSDLAAADEQASVRVVVVVPDDGTQKVDMEEAKFVEDVAPGAFQLSVSKPTRSPATSALYRLHYGFPTSHKEA
ncbi:hypothetical protein LTR85_012266 [Meristemomyces frigidus]|nr:hypothetical protein LTR85_012266 [Meristemomyces frigidus]